MTDIMEKEKGDTSAVGRLIRIGRLKRDMTQVEFSEKTGISNEQICRVEKGTIRPSVAYLMSMAPYLAEPLDELLELSGYMGSLKGEYDYTFVDGKERIYMDTSGKSVDITKAGLKIYEKDPVLFTLLNENIEHLSKMDIELLVLILKVMGKEVQSDADKSTKMQKSIDSLKVFVKNFLECALEEV